MMHAPLLTLAVQSHLDKLVVNRADCPPDDSTAYSPIEEAHNTAPPSDRVANEVVGEQLQMLTDLWTVLNEEPRRQHK